LAQHLEQQIYKMSVTIHIPIKGEDIKLAAGISVKAAEDRIRKTFRLQGGAIEDNNGIVVSEDDPLHAGLAYTFAHCVAEGNVSNLVQFKISFFVQHHIAWQFIN
jgi:hypothetical protein